MKSFLNKKVFDAEDDCVEALYTTNKEYKER